MKKILSLLAALAFITVAHADSIVYPLTQNVVSNIFSSGKIITSITITATTANNTTVIFHDASALATNYVQAAYSRYASYQTNYSTVFTNEANLLITNTFRGTWTYPTTVTVATNALPAIATFVVPASGQRSKDVRIQTIRGLNVQADFGAIVEVDYINP